VMKELILSGMRWNTNSNSPIENYDTVYMYSTNSFNRDSLP
jgi:hypothetical protein